MSREINEAVNDYIRRATDGDWDDAFHGLLELGEGAIGPLAEHFHAARDHALRAWIVNVAWQTRAEASMQLLSEALADPAPVVWKEALDGLVTIATPNAIHLMEQALVAAGSSDYAGWVREALEQAREAAKRRDAGAVEPEVLRRRVRNRIIEVLELTSSFDEQRKYQQAVPFVSVPNEVVNQWEDWVHDIDWTTDTFFTPPVFTEVERGAIQEFDDAWRVVTGATPNPLPPLEETLRLPAWWQLREAATAALAVLLVRGKLSED